LEFPPWYGCSPQPAESEVSVIIVASMLYVYFVSFYTRMNPPHPEKSLDLLGVFLTTYGVVVFLAMIGGYFAFLKTFSDYYGRRMVRGLERMSRRRSRMNMRSRHSAKPSLSTSRRRSLPNDDCQTRRIRVGSGGPAGI